MSQGALSENPRFSQGTQKILDLSRDALATRLGISADTLPNKDFFRLVDGEIDKLRTEIIGAPSETKRQEILSHRLLSMNGEEASERIQEAKTALDQGLLTVATGGITQARDTLAKEGLGATMQVLGQIQSIGHAQNLGEVAQNLDTLANTFGSTSSKLDSAFLSIKKSLVTIFENSAFGSIWKSLKKLFGGEDTPTTSSNAPSPEMHSPSKEENPQEGQVVPSAAPDKPEKSPEQMAKEIGDQLWRRYVGSGWVTNSEAQKKAFFEVYSRYGAEFVKIGSTLLTNAQDTNKEWNIFDELAKYPLLATKFLLALIARGVISEKAIMLNMYDAGRATLGVYLLSPFTLIQNGPSQVLKDFGAIDASELGTLDTVEKQTMISILSHSMAPQLFLAGKLSSSLAKITLLGMYWDQGTGFTKAKSSMNVIQGELQKGIDSVDEILRMLGTNTRTAGLSEYTSTLSQITNQAKEMALVAEIFRDGERAAKTPAQIAQIMEDVLVQKGINFTGDSDISRLLNQLKMSPDIMDAKLNVTSYLTNIGTNKGSFSRFVSQARSMFMPMSTNPSQLQYFIDDARLSLKNYGVGLAEVVKNHTILGFNAMKKAGLAMSQAEFIDTIEKGHLPIKAANASDARGILQQIIKNVPKGLEHAFAGVTVILTIAHVSQAPADQKAMTALLDTAAMWPVVGGLILMHEGFTLQGSQPVRLGYLAGGGLVTALGVREMTALISRYGVMGGTGRALATPATMVIDSIGAGARGAQYLYQMARFGPRGALGVLGVGGELTVAQRIRPTSLLAVGALISFLVLNEIFEKQTRQVLLSAGILKDDGSIDAQNLKEGWKKVPKDEQQKILDIILASFEESNLSIKYDTLKNTITVHTPKVVNGLPVPENLFSSLRKIFHDTGIQEPKIFLSENALATTRKYITSLPVSDSQKKALLAQYNIRS